MCAAKKNPFDQEEYGQYIDVNGLNVHYYEQGIGTPVIFLHGIGQTMYTFRNNVEDFSACFRVIVPDLLGHGGTDGEDCDFLIEDYSEFLLSFMNAMNIDSAHFFAFSTGAVIAMDFALAFPERVKKLILVSPGGVESSYPSAIRSMSVPVYSDFRFVFFNRNMIRSALADAYFDKTLITEDVVESYYKALSNPYALDAAMTTDEIVAAARAFFYERYGLYGEGKRKLRFRHPAERGADAAGGLCRHAADQAGGPAECHRLYLRRHLQASAT